MPVVHYSTNYKFPARYDDKLTVITQLREKPTSKITFDYEVVNEKGDKICDAKVILVFLNKNSFRPQRIPQHLMDLLSAASSK